MKAFIPLLAVGLLISILAIINMTGNISSLHWYHRHRVTEENKKPFGKKLASNLAEGLIELIVMLICFGIGALIVWLCGIDLNDPNLDHDWLILLGLVVFALIIAAISALVIGIKKISKKKSPNATSEEDSERNAQ